MNPLETATLEELMDEIKRRARAGVIITIGQNPKHPDLFGSQYWGSALAAIGGCDYVRHRCIRDIESDPVDTPPPDVP